MLGFESYNYFPSDQNRHESSLKALQFSTLTKLSVFPSLLDEKTKSWLISNLLINDPKLQDLIANIIAINLSQFENWEELFQQLLINGTISAKSSMVWAVYIKMGAEQGPANTWKFFFPIIESGVLGEGVRVIELFFGIHKVWLNDSEEVKKDLSRLARSSNDNNIRKTAFNIIYRSMPSNDHLLLAVIQDQLEDDDPEIRAQAQHIRNLIIDGFNRFQTDY